jgi:hypothetical protein
MAMLHTLHFIIQQAIDIYKKTGNHHKDLQIELPVK